MNDIATPRPSATICLLRDGTGGVEVMMGRRSAAAKFMAKAWVFPGGRVDEVDMARGAELVEGDNDASQLPWILAALRETVEEAGIWLTSPPRVEALGNRAVYDVLDDAGQPFVTDAAYFANWVTPADMPIRYDARFFATVMAAELDPLPDGREIDDAQWVRPRDAMLRAARREWLIPFPTHITLEQLGRATSAADFMARAAELAVETVQPRIRIELDGSLHVVMPGDPGFDDLPEANADRDALADAVRRARAIGDSIAELE